MDGDRQGRLVERQGRLRTGEIGRDKRILPAAGVARFANDAVQELDFDRRDAQGPSLGDANGGVLDLTPCDPQTGHLYEEADGVFRRTTAHRLIDESVVDRVVVQRDRQRVVPLVGVLGPGVGAAVERPGVRRVVVELVRGVEVAAVDVDL